MVTVDPEVDPKVGKNVPHTRDIVVYFCLPTCGKAIGLRPGDILLFNPLFYHAVSKRTKAYENKQAFVVALYLKTAVIGGSDNREKLTRK